METNNPTNQEREYQRKLEAVTLDYIKRFEAGEKPSLADYQSRYPDMAADLAANIAYYQLEGRRLLEEIEQDEATPGYASRLQAEISQDPDYYSKRDSLLDKFFEKSSAATIATLSSFSEAADAQDMGLDELAEEAGISLDIMMAFEQRLVKIKGLPHKLVNRLAELLQVSSEVILNTLRQPPVAAAFHFNQDVPQEVELQDFVMLVEKSIQLDTAQKAEWLNEARNDAYTEN
ncbi:MAG TPA: hypothetical protein VH186_09505 [Chloroflexia bacterium]|nr:hypothetical protein [Chloroflexia bacterium]